MSFQVKFQFKIRQKCRSKWNDIGHTLELGLVIEQIHDVSLNPLSRFSLSNSNKTTTWNRQLRECRSSKVLFWSLLYHNLVIISFLIWTKTFCNFLYRRTEHSWKTNFEQDLITEHTIAEQKKIQHIDSIKMFFFFKAHLYNLSGIVILENCSYVNRDSVILKTCIADFSCLVRFYHAHKTFYFMVNTFSLSEIGVLLPRAGPCNHQWRDEKRFLYTIAIYIYIYIYIYIFILKLSILSVNYCQ